MVNQRRMYHKYTGNLLDLPPEFLMICPIFNKLLWISQEGLIWFAQRSTENGLHHITIQYLRADMEVGPYTTVLACRGAPVCAPTIKNQAGSAGP
jgi:hypothetical protein